MSQVRGVADLGIFPVLGQPNLNIKVDRAKAARYGLNSGDVNTVVQAAMGGAVATHGPGRRPAVRSGRPLCAGIPRQHRQNPQHQGGLSNRQRRQCLHPLERTGDHHPGYRSGLDLSREHASASSRSSSACAGRDLGGTVEEAQERIAENVKLPPGYRLVWAGEFGDLQEAKAAPGYHCADQLRADRRDCSTACSITCAIACWRWPAFPYAIVGGILALYVSGLNFSISAAIGFVSLFGVSVMDGILMITFYNQERRAGLCARGSHVPRRHHPHAAPADDGALRLHRPVSRRHFHRHRQPGAAAAGHGDRRRHAGGSRHAASGGARAENDIYRPGS